MRAKWGRVAAKASPIQETHRHLVDSLLSYARLRFGKYWMREPALRFFVEDPARDEASQIFMPWVLYDWRIGKKPLVDWFLADRETKLSRTERAWLEAEATAYLSIFRVESVRHGARVRVTDVLTGTAQDVEERGGSAWLRRHDHVLARVAQFQGQWFFVGVHPQPLYPEAAELLAGVFREQLAGSNGLVPVDQLRAHTLSLARCWQSVVRKVVEQFGTRRAPDDPWG